MNVTVASNFRTNRFSISTAITQISWTNFLRYPVIPCINISIRSNYKMAFIIHKNFIAVIKLTVAIVLLAMFIYYCIYRALDPWQQVCNWNFQSGVDSITYSIPIYVNTTSISKVHNITARITSKADLNKAARIPREFYTVNYIITDYDIDCSNKRLRELSIKFVLKNGDEIPAETFSNQVPGVYRHVDEKDPSVEKWLIKFVCK
jgi:hypothetical protein